MSTIIALYETPFKKVFYDLAKSQYWEVEYPYQFKRGPFYSLSECPVVPNDPATLQGIYNIVFEERVKYDLNNLKLKMDK